MFSIYLLNYVYIFRPLQPFSPKIFLYVLRNAKTDFLRCIDYLSFTKDRIKHDLLQIQVFVLQLNFLNY